LNFSLLIKSIFEGISDLNARQCQTISNGESVELKAEDGRWTPGVVISRHFDNGLLRIVKILPLPSRGQKRQLDGAGCWLTVEDARIAQPGTHIAAEDVKWSVEQW